MEKHKSEAVTASEKAHTLNSLQAKALDRAMGGDRPKTMTPWEWEQWYQDHGFPEEFKAS